MTSTVTVNNAPGLRAELDRWEKENEWKRLACPRDYTQDRIAFKQYLHQYITYHRVRIQVLREAGITLPRELCWFGGEEGIK